MLNGEVPKNGGETEGLKLRISKMMLNKPNSKETVAENGIKCEEREEKRRKKERKRKKERGEERKSSKNGREREEVGREEGPSPMKIPRIKIKIGGEAAGQPAVIEPKTMGPEMMGWQQEGNSLTFSSK